MNTMQDILKDSDYSLSIFESKFIDELEKKITIKNGKPYIECLIRKKEIILKPEEAVRQLYLAKLLQEYEYPKNRIKLEHPVHFGRQVKAADIVILDKDRPTVEYIIVEVKKPKLQDGKNQLRSYTNATGAPIAVWTNGRQISHYHRKDPNYFEDITDIPKADQTLEDILKERFTLKDLIIKDKIPNEGKSLKTIIQEMEDEVLANAGVDVFEEVFKLIFTKLCDELESRDDKKFIERFLKKDLSEEDRGDYEKIKEYLQDFDDNDFRAMEFRNTGQSESELKAKIQRLFDKAKQKWPGVFDEAAEIQLSPSHLAVSVSSFQDIKLFNSNLQIIDEAFEYLVNKSSKGEKGQYFTPRHVIDMCVKMLNPKAGEYMIDSAAGSCGFPVHTIFHITGHLFQNAEIPEDEKENVLKIFGIDFDEKVVRVARTLNLIAGDGNTNVLHLNNLDYDRWNETIENRSWLNTYGAGLRLLEKLQKDTCLRACLRAARKQATHRQKSSYKEFNFDILMANPPFAGDIKESRIIHKYELGYNEKGKPKSKVGRDILFIERNLNFLKPGGRMAIVLPQGRFNNTSDKQIREYIAEKARILAVVGLHVNTFKPHTGTKTSVLFLQKWNDDASKGPLCPKREDYPIFFAVSEKPGKDNSGDYVFVKNLPAPRPTVYVIRCENESFYIGQTKNLFNRWQEHKNGKVSWTSKYKPLEVIHYEEFTTQSEAVKREKELKTGFGRQWLKREYKKNNLNKWNEDIASRQAGGNGHLSACLPARGAQAGYAQAGPKLDKNGHMIIDHDLHNHDLSAPSEARQAGLPACGAQAGGELPDGVAEKFIEWAKSENLSFWK